LKKYLNFIVVLISAATVLSGGLQVLAPAFVLRLVGAEITPTTSHFFAIIGMFMFLFGGLMLHTVYSARSSRVPVLWCALQKIGACIAVGIGIYNGLFSMMAAGVALFDLLSGLLFLYYHTTLKPDESN